MTRAATPATCGVAIDVPESTRTSLPVPMPAATMLTPGAVTSGLRALSPKRGPQDEKLARSLYVGLAIMPAEAMVTVSPLAASSAAPSAISTPMNGIVTPGIGPSKGGRPALVLTMMTATAPYFWPSWARRTRAQVPRWVTTIFPATPPSAV